MKKFISIILTLACLVGMFVPAEAEVIGSLDSWNLINSGSLDATVTIDNDVVHSGRASARFNRSTPEKSQTYGSFTQSVAVENGKTYKFGLWAKAKNIKQVSVLINWGARVYLNPVSSSYEWTYFSFSYTHSEPSSTATFRIIIGGPIGAFWIDDLEFCEYKDGVKGKNLLVNPGFEGNSASASTVIESTGAAVGKDVFTVEDFNNSIAFASQIPVYKTDKIKIDGDISDWEGATYVEFPDDEIHTLKYVNSPVSAKVSMNFAYDEKYFYFLTKAEDDELFEVEGSDYWQGDGIQLCLSEEGQSYGAEIGFNSIGKYSLNFGTDEMRDLLLETVRNDGVTYYEAAIPWELYYGEFKDQIKFSAIYNENDGDGRKHVFQLAPGIASGKTNAKFPTLQMVPDEKGFFAWVDGNSSCTVFEENIYDVCILNTSDEEKKFTIEVDGKSEEMTVPAGMGKKTKMSLSFDDVGHLTKEFKFNIDDFTYIFNYRCQVIATPDYYDGALEELKSKTDEINNLIAECDKLGISTDYEKPVAFILERFATHIKENAKKEVYDTMDYTFTELERMYERAKTDLTAYLSGEKEALASPKYTSGDIDIIGQTHWANTKVESTGEEEYRPVFFTGYGHFEEAYEDIEYFKDLGNNTIQIGINWSCDSIVRPQSEIPFYSVGATLNNPQVSYSLEKNKSIAQSGAGYIKIVRPLEWNSQTYSRLSQTVAVEPNTTYEFGAKVKATDVKGGYLRGEDWPPADRCLRLTGTYDWKEVSMEITTGPDQTSTVFGGTFDNQIGELLIDDMFFRKKGTRTNLLKNGNFEDGSYEDVGDKYRIMTYKIKELCKIFEEAEDNNINIAFLLEPHMFPVQLLDDEKLRKMHPYDKGVCTYIREPQIREILDLYAKYLITELVKYDSLGSFCIMNEPTLHTNEYDFYKDDWANYLKDIYNDDINELNRLYEAEYENFESVPMPVGTATNVHFYDYRQFNDKILYEWNVWWTDTIRKYAPDVPLHAKIMSTNFEDDSALRVHLTHGSNYEKYALFSDVNGCDAFNYYNPVKQKQKLGNNTNPTTTSALEKTQWYDMLVSNKFRPVYDTEGHVIKDSSQNFIHENAIHVGADNWQAAMHGRGLVNYWVWVSHHVDAATANSFQTRPDAIYEVSKTTLDMNRLSYEVSAVADKKPDVAIMLSDTSRVYDYAYENNVYKAYEASLYTGVKTSYITDNTVDWAHNYEIVICPNTQNVKKEVALELLKYAKSGKTLVLLGRDCLTKDERDQLFDEALVEEIRNNSMIIETVNDGFKMTEPKDLKQQLTKLYNEKGMRPVRVVYADTGIDVDMVEYMYTNYNGKLLLNLCLYDWTSDQDIRILINDKPVTSSVDLRSMQEMGEIIHLKTHEPIFLEIEDDVIVDETGIAMQINNPVMIADGKRMPVDAISDKTVPVIKDSRTLLPIRAIMDAVGGESEWEQETRTVICKYNGNEVKMVIDSTSAYINGEEKSLDVAPSIINDRTMIPVRFVAEAFGLTVDWDGTGKIVTINK